MSSGSTKAGRDGLLLVPGDFRITPPETRPALHKHFNVQHLLDRRASSAEFMKSSGTMCNQTLLCLICKCINLIKIRPCWINHAESSSESWEVIVS